MIPNTTATTDPRRDATGTTGLASRLQQTKIGQSRALLEQRTRREDAQDERAKAGSNSRCEAERAKASPEGKQESGPKSLEDRLHEARRKEFNALFEPIMNHMGCDQAERAVVRDVWGSPAEIVMTLGDWYTKVAVYEIPVDDGLRERSFNHFRATFAAVEPASVPAKAYPPIPPRAPLAAIVRAEPQEPAVISDRSPPAVEAVPVRPVMRRIGARN